MKIMIDRVCFGSRSLVVAVVAVIVVVMVMVNSE